MAERVLIDTSTWVQALRKNGDPAAKARIAELLGAGSAAWCEIIRLELWAGIRGEQERLKLIAFEKVVQNLPITQDIWELAYSIADLAQRKGKHFPANDILIFACAKHYQVGIGHSDKHYTMLEGIL